MNKKILSVLGFVLVVFTLVLAGCGGNTEESGLADISTAEGEMLSDSGVLVLRVNPELAIEYNKDGAVTDVVGRNEDGQAILTEYSDFVGKDSGQVLEELINLIDEAGYFVEEVEGESKQIILELETGSVLPEDEFLEEMTSNVQTAVSSLDVESDVLSNEDVLTVDEAKQIALDDAEVKAEDAHFDDKELEKDDGNLIFELEFYANGYEYEYDIQAVTGEILKSERDHEHKQTKNDATKEAKQNSQQETDNNKNDYISMDRAKEIALEHAGKSAGDVHFDDLEFDIDDGVPHFEIEFDVGPNEYDYDIHAVTGKIIEYEHDLEKSPNKSKTKDQVPAEKQPTAEKEISKEEAIKIALDHAGLKRSEVLFDDVELEYEDGRKEWEIDFDHGNWEYDYEIDASSGSILDFEKEYDD